jgi:hypothetical protein
VFTNADLGWRLQANALIAKFRITHPVITAAHRERMSA